MNTQEKAALARITSILNSLGGPTPGELLEATRLTNKLQASLLRRLARVK